MKLGFSLICAISWSQYFDILKMYDSSLILSYGLPESGSLKPCCSASLSLTYDSSLTLYHPSYLSLTKSPFFEQILHNSCALTCADPAEARPKLRSCFNKYYNDKIKYERKSESGPVYHQGLRDTCQHTVGPVPITPSAGG